MLGLILRFWACDLLKLCVLHGGGSLWYCTAGAARPDRQAVWKRWLTFKQQAVKVRDRLGSGSSVRRDSIWCLQHFLHEELCGRARKQEVEPSRRRGSQACWAQFYTSWISTYRIHSRAVPAHRVCNVVWRHNAGSDIWTTDGAVGENNY